MSDEEELPTVKGNVHATLTRPDLNMMILLRTGQVTERIGQLCMKGHPITPVSAEALQIRSLIRKGVVEIQADKTVQLTPEAEELVVQQCARYGMDLKGITEKIMGMGEAEALDAERRRREAGES